MTNRHMTDKNPSAGFTLIELLVTIVIVGLVTTGLFTTFYSQNNSYLNQGQVVGMQQNLRAGFDLLSREVRMAGFNPTRSATAIGFVTADADSLAFTADIGEDGAVAATENEAITYALYDVGGVSTLGRKAISTAASFDPVAENIIALGFAYAFDSNDDRELEQDGTNVIWAVESGGNWFDLDVNDDGQITAADDTDSNGVINGEDTGIVADLDDIRAVRIWALARTDNQARDFTENRAFVVGNQVVSPNDKNRHRLLTTVSKCRNMGL